MTPKALKTSFAATLIAGLALCALNSNAFAQQQPPTQPKAATQDPRMLAAQQAFEALPETERKAIQLDLSFATSFNGAALGTFGSLTFTGVQNFERDNKLIVDGILTPQERQLLATMANNVRRAIQFSVLDDQRSGSKIGIPKSIFSKQEANAAGGSRWQSSDGMATLDTITIPSGGDTLQQLFDKAILPTPSGRKVTYKLFRPDFFVVAGETPSGKFYRRLASTSDGKLTGFSIGYSKAMGADMDKLVIAIANTFEPFPATKGSIPIATPSTSSPPAMALSVASRIPEKRERLASAIILDSTTVLTSEAAVKNCRAITVGSKRTEGRIIASESATGLAIIKANNLQSQPLGLNTQQLTDQSLVIVTQAWSGNSPVGVFSEATRQGLKSLNAPLQPGGTGGALFDTKGELVGIIVDDPSARKVVAGVVPTARYRFASGEDIATFLQKQSVAFPKDNRPPSESSVAGARRDSVIPLMCDPV
jgi:peptidoglycan hydrolase-like protein with peptidoglycan-binding domain